MSNVELNRKPVLKEFPSDNSVVGVRESRVIESQHGVEAISSITSGEELFIITGPIIEEATIYTFQVGTDKHLDPKREMVFQDSVIIQIIHVIRQLLSGLLKQMVLEKSKLLPGEIFYLERKSLLIMQQWNMIRKRRELLVFVGQNIVEG